MHKEVIEGKVPFTPEEAGYDETYLGYLNDFIIRLMDQKILQGGAYRLVRHGKLFAQNSVGDLDFRDDTKALQPDSLMRIASITKTFTTIALFQLAERGYIDIFDPVAKHLKEFDTNMHRKITVYNLLTHTSGLLPDGGAFDIPYRNSWEGALECCDKNWVAAYLTEAPHCPPNKEWAYSTRCFSLLGEIIQRITGQRAEDYIIENIAIPLRLTDTFFDVPESQYDRMIVSCDWQIPLSSDERHRRRLEWIEKEQGADSISAMFMKKYDMRDLKIPQTGGGLHSSLKDLTTYGEMMLNNGILGGKRIISRKSLENITHSHLDGQNIPNFCWGADEIHNCGLGMEVMTGKPFHQMTEGTFGHEGAGVSWLYVDPKEEFVAAVFLPYYHGEFNIIPIHNSKYIIWGGLI